MQTLNLQAPDISCDHCKATIEREVGSVPGVTAVSVDVPTRRVSVSYDAAATTEGAIIARLDDEGYPATVST